MFYKTQKRYRQICICSIKWKARISKANNELKDWLICANPSITLCTWEPYFGVVVELCMYDSTHQDLNLNAHFYARVSFGRNFVRFVDLFSVSICLGVC